MNFSSRRFLLLHATFYVALAFYDLALTIPTVLPPVLVDHLLDAHISMGGLGYFPRCS